MKRACGSVKRKKREWRERKTEEKNIWGRLVCVGSGCSKGEKKRKKKRGRLCLSTSGWSVSWEEEKRGMGLR